MTDRSYWLSVLLGPLIPILLVVEGFMAVNLGSSDCGNVAVQGKFAFTAAESVF